ncbi:HAD-IB family hydrolase [Acinetobacter boissieri]|uniref:HAD-superfamily subfamily IB hydrolase, TIGR01490 n=1 Tax=Acinetobacter boissieri TaxID=1219383 RepID=A0A1G6H8G9_9GAMM|nr:HAD-IB family hydrolase [Acinetobacter boissieri]SDB90511.1 HAD-superfamily subfamily IB hydrolase, TIGR01490 [Acinetobacter boissieri]
MVNLALFDFDHTLTHTDSFKAFLSYSLSKTAYYKGHFKLLHYIVGYQCKMITDQKLRQKICQTAFAQYHKKQLLEIGRTFADTYLDQIISPHAKQRLTWHQSQGDRVVVVSSSLDVYLKPWCEKQGIDVICNQMTDNGTHYTGVFLGGDCGYEEKARRVQQRYNLTDYEQIFAYGDSNNDSAMLALADQKFYRWQKQ